MIEPYYHDEEYGIVIYNADCRDVLPQIEESDLVLADPPYGDTSLEWDKKTWHWSTYLNTNCMWCFGSFRYFFDSTKEFSQWKLAQEVIWEKHNGSGFHADRFKRVHEIVVQFYRGDWESITKNPQYTNDATKRTVRRKGRPSHTGNIGEKEYCSEDGGPRLMRSVLHCRSCHGTAVHPTQKPLGIVLPLVEYSSNEGDTILDPFMGSGTTLVAAKQLGRKAIGIEIDKKYCDIAIERLRQKVMRFE